MSQISVFLQGSSKTAKTKDADLIIRWKFNVYAMQCNCLTLDKLLVKKHYFLICLALTEIKASPHSQFEKEKVKNIREQINMLKEEIYKNISSMHIILGELLDREE
jgi:DNA-directed RNA polymerase specialized sigma54-like protein